MLLNLVMFIYFIYFNTRLPRFFQWKNERRWTICKSLLSSVINLTEYIFLKYTFLPVRTKKSCSIQTMGTPTNKTRLQTLRKHFRKPRKKYTNYKCIPLLKNNTEGLWVVVNKVKKKLKAEQCFSLFLEI